MASAQTSTLSGRVTDAATKEPLSAAVVRIVGTNRGSIANPGGDFRVSLENGEWTLVFSYLGYASDTVRLKLTRDTVRDVALVPRPIPIAEVVVTGEDPAVGIMRKVIANKHRWQEALHSYRFEAFTRQVIRRDTAIAQIAESYTTGYWQQGDSIREIVRQRRQTNNVPSARNFAGVGSIVNFYDDDIRFVGYSFVGPTSPEAFDNYAFRLEGSRLQDSREVFLISLLPRSRTTPLFSGTIRVADVDFALVGVDVAPNEAFTLPFLEQYELSYTQQFQRFDGTFWLPVNIRVRGRFTLGLPGITIPPFGLESNSSLYEYAVNVEVPDSLFHQPRRIVAKEAASVDSLFWRSHEVLPLTVEERGAYVVLDSTQTLDRQFRPTGILAAIGSSEASALDMVDVRFNRVQGWYLGGRYSRDTAVGRFGLDLGLGYGIADHRWEWLAGASAPLDAEGTWKIRARFFDIITKESDDEPHLALTNSVSAITSKSDHWDYYYRRGWLAGVRTQLGRFGAADLAYARAHESSAAKHTDWSLLRSGDLFRMNPPADEGIVSSMSLRYELGKEEAFGLIRTNHLEAEMERAGGVLGGDLTFTRVSLSGEWHVQTFLRRSLFPATLSVRVAGDAAWGRLPRQRTFTLPTSHTTTFDPLGLFQAVGAREFTGDRSLALFLEQNFRSFPFALAGLPFLYRRSIDLVMFVHAGRTWVADPRIRAFITVPDTWVAEAGIGLGRLFGFFRLDVARRFTPPGRWELTASLSPLL